MVRNQLSSIIELVYSSKMLKQTAETDEKFFCVYDLIVGLYCHPFDQSLAVKPQ